MGINRVLVVGGTGMLGKPVAQQLAEDGYEVTIGSRSLESVRRVFGDRLPGRLIDMSDPDSILEALQEQDAVHLNLPSGPTFEDCYKNEFRAAKALAVVAMESGIQRVSYISGANVREDQSFPPSRAKWLAEQAIRNCGVPYTIWRPSWFLETLSKLMRGGVLVMMGDGRVKAHWLAARDLGKWLGRALKMKDAENRVFYAFGSENISFREVVKTYRDVKYSHRPIITVPIGFVEKMGKWTGSDEMWFGAQMFRFLENDPETGDPTEANKLFGAMTTTVRDFALL